MSNRPPHQPLSLADVDEWVEHGLITAEQGDAIRRHVAERAPAPRGRFSLQSVVTYFGGFLVLLAYTIFVGTSWSDLTPWVQVAVAGGTIGVLLVLGWLIRGLVPTGGNLLIFAAAGIAPLLAYSLMVAGGLWADSPDYLEYYRSVRGQWVLLEIAGIAAALAAAWLTRFPLNLLLASFWIWFLSLDLVRLVSGADRWAWGVLEWIGGALIGAALIGAGFWLERTGRERYGFWPQLWGLFVVLSHLGALAVDEEGIYALLYLIVSLAIVVVSVRLQRWLFLVFGAIGVYSYVTYLAFDVFDGAVGFSIALGAIGLLSVLGVVAYQRLRPAAG